MLILVRHGESAANAAGALSGRAESPLTENGRSQVASLSALVEGASRLISSPLGRARETAGTLGLGLPIDVDERWTEIDYGELEGVSLTAVPPDVWRRWRSDPSFRPPGGETVAEVGMRVRDACDELFSRPGSGARADGDVVVVSHVSPIKAAVAWALGAGDDVAWRLHLSTASLTRVAWGVDGPVLHSFNDTTRT
ncbi:MAG TPA: histidine phosphatase family protein [Acidimicrobiales bacterium]|nr:histidine phosphatase family protein [Acidimicrobiales bacterium]